MSLIRTRRERRELSGSGPKKPPPLVRLLLLLAFVAALIVWMDRLAG